MEDRSCISEHTKGCAHVQVAWLSVVGNENMTIPCGTKGELSGFESSLGQLLDQTSLLGPTVASE